MSHLPRKSARLPQAFTLTEAIITMGIIAVLTAILFPVISNARASAKAVECTGHLRQLYTGLVAYAQDHRGYLPRGGTNSTDNSGFSNWGGTAWMKPTINPQSGFPAYCGGQEVVNQLVVCPLNRAVVSATQAYQYTPIGYPYICNYEAMTQTGLSRLPANLWKVKKDQLILLMDSGVGSDWKGHGLTSGAGWDRFAERHQDRGNTLWADGRVTKLKRSELRTPILLPENHD